MKKSEHLAVAKKSGLIAVGKFGLGAMFTGFSGRLPALATRLSIGGGGVLLLATDVYPSLTATLSEADSAGWLLWSIHYLKKVVALLELAALAGVGAEQYYEVKGAEDAATLLRKILTPSFVVLLTLKSGLDGTEKVVRGVKKGQIPIIISGQGGSFTQAALLVGLTLGKLSSGVVNTTNAGIGFIQSAVSATYGLWNYSKSKPDVAMTQHLLSINDVI
jgi:hypothetical protein